MSSSAVYLYAPCALSKRSDVSPLSIDQIAGIRSLAPTDRMAEWVDAAWSHALPRRPFEETYSGGFWGFLRKESPPSGVYVCAVSAGFGLLPPGALIPNYDATFTLGSRNCVGGDTQTNREWWRLLGHHAPKQGRPSGITDALRNWPGTHILALPQLYLDAVWDDVCEAIEDRDLHSRIVVLTTPYAGSAFGSPRSLTVSSGLRAELGGTIGTLLPRLALRIASGVADRAGDLAAIRESVAKMRVETVLSPKRVRLTDDKIRLFILNFLRDNPNVDGYTAVLRSLRSSGLACEMKRFRSVFREAYKSIHV